MEAELTFKGVSSEMPWLELIGVEEVTVSFLGLVEFVISTSILNFWTSELLSIVKAIAHGDIHMQKERIELFNCI